MRMWAICVKVYEAHVYSGYMGKVGGLNVMLFCLYTACVGQARGSLYSLDITPYSYFANFSCSCL